MSGFVLVLFAIAAGFTASGITANLYRLSGMRAKGMAGQVLRAAIMVIAGPSMIFENAMQGRITRAWRGSTFWLVTGAITYWSLALGLFVMDVLIHI